MRDVPPTERTLARFLGPPGSGVSLRVAVTLLATAVVLAMAAVVADRVADHMRRAAIDAALHNIEAIVRGYVDPVIREETLALGSAGDPMIDAQLRRLTLSGDIRQINVWSRDGSIANSSEPSIRGRRFSIGSEIAEAFLGQSAAYVGSRAVASEGSPHVAVPDRYLQILVPIRGAVDGSPIGVYAVYQAAQPIDDRVDAVRRDVFVIALVAAIGLLTILWLAFAGASRLLARQNRRLLEQAATEELLLADVRRSEERFRSLVRNSSDIILIMAPDGTIAYESPAVERILGFGTAERLGQPALDTADPEDRPWLERLFRDVQRTPGAEVSTEFRARHADGSSRVFEAIVKNLIDDPAVGGVVVNYRDISERKALEEQLRHQAFHDVLTGLANRALLVDRVDHALARAAREPSGPAVLFLDLDDFKAVNDGLGHAAGDGLLKGVGQRLVQRLRVGDTVARMGGDEFAVLIEDAADLSAVVTLADDLRAALRAPFDLGGHPATIRASIGIATRTTPGQTAAELLKNADMAMYAAKSQGRDCSVVFEPRMHSAPLERLRLKSDLEIALDRGEFRLVYQPIVRLATGEVVGVEALIRWDHPSRGVIEPARFIPLAEEIGLIVPIGRWVLQEACRQAAAWHTTPGQAPLAMNVNLSGRQIDDPEIVDDVQEALARSTLRASFLTLEVTESVLVEDASSTIETLERLRELGVRLAIDDFGTGYSSLSYLRRFPVNGLKIDRSFVSSLGPDSEGAALVQSILRMGETLGLEMVAEGIEDAGQLEQLRSLGAEFGQGYYFARPLSAEDLSAMLRASSPSTADRSAQATPGASPPRRPDGRRRASKADRAGTRT